MNEVNPFLAEAACGATADELRRMERERQHKLWLAHVDACLAIMETGVMKRMELAAEAARQWGYKAEVVGVTRTETHTGVIHLRVKLLLELGTSNASHLEFIGSPKSLVIAAEGSRAHQNRRWAKVELTADAISSSIDGVIRDFLKWGVGG